MERDIKLRLMSGLSALIMSTSAISLGTVEAFAEGINTNQATVEQKYKNGTFIEDPLDYEESQYKRYVVEKGDNASLISKKICRYFGEEPTTKYWPVLAFLNQFPRVIRPGDIMFFPGTFEDMDSLWNDLKDIGWIKKYIKENKVYSSQRVRKVETVKDLIMEIYGLKDVSPTLVSSYLSMIGLSDKYNINTKIDGNNDALFELTDWIPMLEEVENYGGVKNKKRK